MFLAPLSDIQQAFKANALGDLNPTPWALMFGNTLGWISYALLRSNWFIFFANTPGFFFSIYFNTAAIKLLHMEAALQSNDATTSSSSSTSSTPTLETTKSLLDHKEHDMVTTSHDHTISVGIPAPSIAVGIPAPSIAVGIPTPPIPLMEPSHPVLIEMPPATDVEMANIPTALVPPPSPPPATLAPAAERLKSHERLILGLMILWMGVLSCVIAAKSWDDDLRQMVLGLTVNGNLVFFYGAPLSTIRQVLTTRSSRWLHGPTMLRNTASGVFWTAYGLAVLDPYVAVPNSLGTLLGIVQMILWVVFPSAKVKTEPVASSQHTLATLGLP